MNIFILDLNQLDNNLLEQLAQKDSRAKKYKIKMKRNQYLAGRFLLNYAARHFYNLSDTSLFYVKNKPFFRNSSLYFNISHSFNIVAVGFSEYDIGLDIEYNKKVRNFSAILERYKDNFQFDIESKLKTYSIQEQQRFFYEFWTCYEAKIKLNSKLENPYLLTIYPVNGFTLSVAAPKIFEIENIFFYPTDFNNLIDISY